MLTAFFVAAASAPFIAAQQRSFSEHNSVYTALQRVPAKAQARPNPMDNDPNTVAAGHKLFEEHCAECHGTSAEGTGRGPSLLVEPVQKASPGAVFWILSNGVIRHGMPDWSKLPEPERWQIVAFLKSLNSGPHHSANTPPGHSKRWKSKSLCDPGPRKSAPSR
jgi:mono/diheme cytochrome c family protein